MKTPLLFLLSMVLVMAAASSGLTACDQRGVPKPTLSSSPGTEPPVSLRDKAVQGATKAAAEPLVHPTTPAAPTTVYVKPPYGASAPMATGSEGINKPVVHGGVDQAPIAVPPPANSTVAVNTPAGGLVAPEALLNGTPAAAGPNAGTPAPLSATDERFLVGALDAALAELRMSQLAAEKANNSIVKSYAALLISDQAALVANLQRLAQQRDVPVQAALSDSRQRALDSVSRASQDGFDQTYLKAAGSAENQALITLFERADRDARDPALKALVQSALPTLRAHLSASEQLPFKG